MYRFHLFLFAFNQFCQFLTRDASGLLLTSIVFISVSPEELFLVCSVASASPVFPPVG
jgi:hypothetical protein